MPNCNTEHLTFPSFDRRKIEGSFSGGDVSSDGGVMALRAADRRLGLLKALDAAMKDHVRATKLPTARLIFYGSVFMGWLSDMRISTIMTPCAAI